MARLCGAFQREAFHVGKALLVGIKEHGRPHFLFVELLHAQDARRFVVVVEVKVGGVEIPVFEHNEHEVVRMKFSEILAALVIVEALHVGIKPHLAAAQR